MVCRRSRGSRRSRAKRRERDMKSWQKTFTLKCANPKWARRADCLHCAVYAASAGKSHASCHVGPVVRVALPVKPTMACDVRSGSLAEISLLKFVLVLLWISQSHRLFRSETKLVCPWEG